MSVTRRDFLEQAGAVTLGFAGLHALVRTSPLHAALPVREGFGPLVADPNGIFDLPAGFRYTVVSRTGDLMTDGLLVPHRPDGMATFRGPDGLTLLVRNHEVSSGAARSEGPFGPNDERRAKLTGTPFDPCHDDRMCLGGTTTVVYDTKKQVVVRQFLSLIGTVRNCAGGPTPWGSWLTGEETLERAGARLAQDHGWVFEVPATAEPALAEPRPLKALGRFNHEALAVDPVSGVVYETEDDAQGLIYRLLPKQKGKLSGGGVLQALAVRGRPSLDTRNWEGGSVAVGTKLSVEWIDMDEVESPNNDLRLRGFAKGAARFARGEGMWYGRGAVYFACTNGGPAKRGQIWRYTPSAHEGTSREAQSPGSLELFVESTREGLLENCDNLTVAPWGDLVVCEDGGGEQFLVGVTPSGAMYHLGRNAISQSELAGAVFSPDGTTLFVNVQHSGLTLAITGLWQSRRG